MVQKSTIAIIGKHSPLMGLLKQQTALVGVELLLLANISELPNLQANLWIDDTQEGLLVIGLALNGREEVISKPLKISVLIKKIEELLAENQDRYVVAESWRLDSKKDLLHIGENSILLTEKEAALIGHLLRNYPDAMSKESLENLVWGYAEGVDTQTLQTHIYRLRQKLKSYGDCIKTTANGYFLDIKAS